MSPLTQLELLKQTLRERCDQASALWYSGGKDSRLLLEIVKAENLPCTVLRFDDGWTIQQKLAAYENADVLLYTYRAIDFLMVGDAEQTSLVAFYPIDGSTSMPVLKDFVPGTRHIPSLRLEYSDLLPVQFTTHIVGSRQSDRHYAVGDRATIPEEEWQIGSCTIIAPLYGWSDTEVVEALKIYNVDYVPPREDLDTGNIPVCPECLTALNEGRLSCTDTEITWNPRQNLQHFQSMIGATT